MPNELFWLELCMIETYNKNKCNIQKIVKTVKTKSFLYSYTTYKELPDSQILGKATNHAIFYTIL
jgi:hypothetical protein